MKRIPRSTVLLTIFLSSAAMRCGSDQAGGTDSIPASGAGQGGQAGGGAAGGAQAGSAQQAGTNQGGAGASGMSGAGAAGIASGGAGSSGSSPCPPPQDGKCSGEGCYPLTGMPLAQDLSCKGVWKPSPFACLPVQKATATLTCYGKLDEPSLFVGTAEVPNYTDEWLAPYGLRTCTLQEHEKMMQTFGGCPTP